MIGLSTSVTWKLYVLILTAVGSTSTYLSFKYIIRNSNYAAAGTFLLMLSQFYIADILQRASVSEYTAFIFIPILVAGIYDFVAYDAKRVYLIGIAFVGLVLSHTIMTMVGLLTTIIVFCSVLLIPSKREKVLKADKLICLIKTAIVSVLVVSYYIFPMIEQMMNDKFNYMEPWAKISYYTQPFNVFFNVTGGFDYQAYIGVGIPILVLLGSRMVLGRPKNGWADYFLFGGLLILVSTTDIVPWEVFNDTFLNMLQFTFRLYPYALCFIVLGLMLYLSEKCRENQLVALISISIISIVFGAWEAVEVNTGERDERQPVGTEFVQENTHYVGRGEWLPLGVQINEISNKAGQKVLSSGDEVVFQKQGYNHYSFEKNTIAAEEYVLPLIYYKGYKAQIVGEDGLKTGLVLGRTEDGLIQVWVEETVEGTVEITYAGTMIQYVSNIVSLITVVLVIVYVIRVKRNTVRVKKKD